VDDLVAWLNRIDGCALGTVVHVGAGAGAVLEQYVALPADRRPRQVVLIEGDPDLAHRLERAAAAYPWARVLPTPVGAQGGPMPWNRFNLPLLNGPLDATALTAVYPRLRRVQTTTLRCEALSDVLSSLDLEPETDERRVHVLVLDVPGQESWLLASLAPELLWRFHAIVLRGCRSVLPPHGQAAEAAPALLVQQHFTPVAKESDRNTLWPAVLMRFDRTGHELAKLRRQVKQMEVTLKERDRLLGELQVVSQAKATAEKLAAERLAKTVEQDDRIRQLDTQLADANLRLELLQHEVLKAEGQLTLMKELLLKEPSL
jgi:hypothetical protein